jgi:dihydroorotate dehydrogenase (fumarate)
MKIEVAGLTLQNHLMNAAYIGSKSTKDLKELINSDCGAIVVGSITVKPRIRNPGPGYWLHKEGFYSLNSYGMPNGGLEYFKNELPTIIKLAHAKKKPVIANIAGFSKDEFVKLIALAQNTGADLVELNLGCPNIWHAGQQERIVSYHPVLIRELLEHIKESAPTIKISVKISPLPPDILREVAEVIIESKIVDAVVATNSYPNAFVSTGTKIGSEEQLAGMSGRALKPISLGVVKQLSNLLPANIDVIGCGGISSVNDVNDYLRSGAKAVQIATALINESPEIFESINSAM